MAIDLVRSTALEDLRNDLKLRVQLPVAIATNGTHERRVARTRFARHAWEAPNREVLQASRQTLLEFWLARGGSHRAFLYRDDEVNTFSEALGVGNGIVKDFPLLRKIGAYEHPVFHPDQSTLEVELDEVPYANWSVVVVNGLPYLRLDAAPGIGVIVTAAGTFDFAVRFDSEFGYSLSVPGAVSGLDQLALVEVFE